MLIIIDIETIINQKSHHILKLKILQQQFLLSLKLTKSIALSGNLFRRMSLKMIL